MYTNSFSFFYGLLLLLHFFFLFKIPPYHTLKDSETFRLNEVFNLQTP
jgi:hypothetical protein